MNKVVLAAFAGFCLAWGGAPARADDPDPREAELDKLYQTVEKLEKRIDDLEASKAQGYGPTAGGGSASGEAGSWADRVRLSGSAALDYLGGGGGGGYGLYDHGSASVYDARLFVDADLARDIELGDRSRSATWASRSSGTSCGSATSPTTSATCTWTSAASPTRAG
jgi:hypothetical protein